MFKRIHWVRFDALALGCCNMTIKIVKEFNVLTICHCREITESDYSVQFMCGSSTVCAGLCALTFLFPSSFDSW